MKRNNEELHCLKIIQDMDTLSFCCDYYRSLGCPKIVLTTGAFDILHEGHTSYLKYARGLGNVLIVAINDDDFVRKIKGDERPYHPHQKRAIHVAELNYVDLTYVFSQDEQISVIEYVKPSVFVMSETSHRKTSERQHQIAAVERCGGRIIVLPPFSKVHSTDIIKELRAKE